MEKMVASASFEEEMISIERWEDPAIPYSVVIYRDGRLTYVRLYSDIAAALNGFAKIVIDKERKAQQ